MLDARMRHTLLGLFLLLALFSGSAGAISLGTPRASLTPRRYEIPLGGSVTLSCFVEGYGNWTVWWYKGASYGSDPEVMKENEGKKAINVSQGGIYYCSGRSDSGSSSYQSDQAIIEETLPIKATVTLQPNWTQIYMGETFTVRCEIPGSEETYWSYRWRPERFSTYYTTNEKKITRAVWSDSGEYQCRGSRGLFFTQWSNIITVTLSFKSRPVLTVSPSWLSPGASVTLNCEVEHPSEGWTFSWYKALPYNDLSQYYTYELLPDGSRTARAFYIINGQKRTAVYVCRAERRSTQFDTDYSNPNFVWSAELCSAATLTLSPHIVQEFSYDSVTMTCEGNSTSWRVRKFPENGMPYCTEWWRSGESICKIYTADSDDGVYWCESLSGEFSNAVNITLQDYYSGPILVSPVDPVNEGTFVSLRCNLRRKKVHPNVYFHHNRKLIQNDTREELNILAVSKSDEGFYKCQYSGKESPSRWMSVKSAAGPESSSCRVSARMKVMNTFVFILVMLLSMNQ